MVLTRIDERGNGAVADVVEASAEEGEAHGFEVFRGRRKVELSGEPPVDGALVGRGDIGEVIDHQGADVALGEFRKQALIAAQRSKLEGRRRGSRRRT